MTLSPKHQKVIASAQRAVGCSTGLYWKEANELKAAGLIEMREHISAVGARSFRWFTKDKG